MQIRPTEMSDYKKVIKLYSLFVGDDRFSKKNSDSFKEVLENSNSFIYVAVDKKKIIGFATISTRKVVRYPRLIAELEELFVLDDYRKHGVGKNLINVIEEKVKELKCKGIFIQSGKDHTVAHQFYKNLGYIERGLYFTKDITL